MEKGIFNSTSSISQYDPYSNPYDLQKQAQPAAIAQRKKSHSHQGKHSLDKGGLQSQMFHRIRKRGVEVFGKKALFFTTIIKHLFFGITLPFYFIFYLFPVKLAQILEGWAEFFAKFFSKFSHKMVFFLKKLFRPIFQFCQKQNRRIQVGLLWVKTAFSYGISALKERGKRWL